MFAFKNKYYLIIENIKDIDLKKIKLKNKFIIIYRNSSKIQNTDRLKEFRAKCRVRRIDFFVANNVKLLTTLKADGLYISSHNKCLNLARFKNYNYQIIGSAHNVKELNLKKKQGCTTYIFSRLFETNYSYKKGFKGLIKFNLFKQTRKESFVPLGGIGLNNLNKLKLVNSSSFALLSEIKKKPAVIFSRLF